MYIHRGNIFLSPKVYKNTICHKERYYTLDFLDDNYKKSKGGNSCVFIANDSDNNEQFVVKISKYDILKPKGKNFNNIKRIARFKREIEALMILKENNCDNIIDIYFNDTIKIKTKEFEYYAMEKADYDLNNFLGSNELSDQQKFMLCIQILNGIKQLHDLRIYHRDIKPDNIFFVGNTWKIGDLGLIDYRDSDISVDELGEKIGPANWMSPEAINKFYVENYNKDNPNKFNCNIDMKSDIYQLGSLFWYIFQGNLPLGQINRNDFVSQDDELYDIIYNMLFHLNNSRIDISAIEEGFKNRYQYYGI